MYTVIETITPKIAEKYLEKNENNRKIRYSVIRNYARDMKNGSWELSPQGISFFENGKLADGQHRLMAIVRSKCTVQMNVTYDVPNNTKVIDRGAVRSEADILHFGGYGKSVANNNSVATVNQLFALCSKKPTTSVVVDFMDKYAEIVVKATNIVGRGSNTTSICRKSPIAAAAFCGLVCGLDEEGIATFFDVANRGFSVSAEQTSAVVLRNYILQKYSGGGRKDREDLFKVTCFALKDFANGRPRTRLYELKNSTPFWGYVKSAILDPYLNSYIAE